MKVSPRPLEMHGGVSINVVLVTQKTSIQLTLQGTKSRSF